MICQNCQHNNSEAAQFCAVCETKLKEIEDNLDAATKELAVALGAIKIEGSEHIRDSQSYVIIRKFGTDCNIEARYRKAPTSEAVSDGYGNEFIPMDMSVMVTYSSHGGADVDLVYDRVTFLRDCAFAAMKLRDEYKHKLVFTLLRSAEQKRLREHEKNAEVVRKAIIINCKGMRVGASKSFCDGTFSDQLIPGVYKIRIPTLSARSDQKLYTAEVSDSKVVTVVRVKGY
jgi:hypothetical protein